MFFSIFLSRKLVLQSEYDRKPLRLEMHLVVVRKSNISTQTLLLAFDTYVMAFDMYVIAFDMIFLRY